MNEDFRSKDNADGNHRANNEPEKFAVPEELVRKSIEGDVDSFGELYRIYARNIYRYVYGYIRENSLAEDITEDVFLKVWQSIKSCRGKENTFSSWLYRIAHNQAVDELRKIQRRQSIDIDDAEPVKDTKNKSEIYSEHNELLSVIDRLPDKQKQVILLKFIEDLDNKEIAMIIGKSEGAVRVLQMRAIRTLKKEFNR